MTLEFVLIVALALACFFAGFIAGGKRGVIIGLNMYQLGVRRLILFGALVKAEDALEKAKLAGLDKFYSGSIAGKGDKITGISLPS